MAIPEDAASVLEQFIHDVANTPAEITHLLEEIQAKDAQISAFRDEIAKRDAQLQKWVRVNGGHVLNPKEEAFSKTINDCYDKCEILQAEKCGLSEKALIVLERQIKRLDVNLRGLAQREEFPADWGGPSLLSGTGTGVSTPATGGGVLREVTGNAVTTGGAPNIANAAQIRMAQQAAASGARPGSGQQTPQTANMARGQRESSTETNKRRRLNATLGSLPTNSSSLRQSSLGPGTPKERTPNPPAGGRDVSRAGSAQPGQRAAAGNKKAGAPPAGKKPPPAGAAGRKRIRTGANKKGDRRRQLTRDRATPSTNASLSGDESDSASPTPSTLQRSQADGTADGGRPSRRKAVAVDDPDDDDVDEEDDEDKNLYCICDRVSFGDMVGCDNEKCEKQWFHWPCVDLTKEPKGTWLCPECRKLPRSEVVISRD